MDRSEILARSRMDNQHHDERERRVTDKACTWGADVHGNLRLPQSSLSACSRRVETRTTCLPSCSRTSPPLMPIHGAKAGRGGTLITAAAYTVGAAALLCAYALLD